MNMQDITSEVVGALITAVLIGLFVYVRQSPHRRAARIERRKLASLIALRMEDVTGQQILPIQLRTINIEHEPDRDKEKLMERFHLIAQSIPLDQQTFVFHFIKRLYQRPSDIIMIKRAEVARLFQILSNPSLAGEAWVALQAYEATPQT